MFYIYVLISKKDNKFYVGYTDDLKRRIEQHNNGYVESTKHRRPLKLIYYEVCINQQDALHREKYLKTSFGKKYIRNRLKNYFINR
ncbi:unnamed protein product [marine sediment metagenome]|uniref:GIY-YIG domain-containing protein n=1 Tax=marine sediment metagenome TaxID=412755 RepID=X1GT28_9ZZZZ